MNLLEILHSRVDALPEGSHTKGIIAVLQHIEVAERHLSRGQTTPDDTAFTDAIYRTNQAFEGSLKEAYRVLAGKDPSGESPHVIENYLQQQNILRQRVLAQFTNYRREWRNPSTHDYRLDFNEDEALVAIVTVSAFAIVLVDQITECISFQQAKAAAAAHPTPVTGFQPLLDRISTLIEQFTVQFNQTHAGRTDIREVELTGALAGFLASAAPELNTQTDAALVPEWPGGVDVLVASADERLIIEVKRLRSLNPLTLEALCHQMEQYMAASGISQAIVFSLSIPNTGKVIRKEHRLSKENSRIITIIAEPVADQ